MSDSRQSPTEVGLDDTLTERDAVTTGARQARDTAGKGISTPRLRRVLSASTALWDSPQGLLWRERGTRWRAHPLSGLVVLLAGGVLATGVALALITLGVPLPSPGAIYLPLIGMLAYYWGWRYGLAAILLQLVCSTLLMLPSSSGIPFTGAERVAQTITLAAVSLFILALVGLAANRRDLAEREAGRFAALNSIGAALASELDEGRLLNLIAVTARDLTSADFAAFTLRPFDPLGHPIVPSEGSLFHLAAVVGCTPEQQELFRRVPLGGEGVLAPIFRNGVPVRVDDIYALSAASGHPPDEEPQGARPTSARTTAREAAQAYAMGHITSEQLRTVGVPRGHPIVRSFLGAPLLDSAGHVRGGLLLGAEQPGRFTAADEALLSGLAAQAAVALETARLYQQAHARAQELDAIFQTISDGVLLVDASGAILRENRAAQQLRDALAQRDDGKDALDTLLYTPAAEALATGTTSTASLTIAGEDTTQPRDFLVTASALRLPGARSAAEGQEPTEAVVTWHDVTEARKLLEERRAHAAADAQRHLLQMVIDGLPSGVYLVRGPDARLVLANHAAHEVWGASWREGQTMDDFLAESGTQILAPDGRALAVDELATIRALRTGEPVRHHEEVIRHPDGVSLPILFNAVALAPGTLRLSLGSEEPYDGDADRDPGAIVVLQDVTALKDAERLKDEFIAVAAHELRNPMAAVRGFADMLTRGRGKDAAPLTDWQLEALDAIDQSTQRLVELTDDLLDVARLQAGRLDLNIEPHDLAALTRRVARRLQVTTERHTLQVSADPEFVVANIDSRRTEQVLGNLVSNAIKYSPDGGEIVVMVRVLCERGAAEVTIRDSGIGIPQSEQATLFSRFARARNAQEHGITGTGLGLYLSRELVERQGGRIWFESVEGHGSTFHVELPLTVDDDENV